MKCNHLWKKSCLFLLCMLNKALDFEKDLLLFTNAVMILWGKNKSFWMYPWTVDEGETSSLKNGFSGRKDFPGHCPEGRRFLIVREGGSWRRNSFSSYPLLLLLLRRCWILALLLPAGVLLEKLSGTPWPSCFPRFHLHSIPYIILRLRNPTRTHPA